MAIDVKILSNLQPGSEPIKVTIAEPQGISVKVSGPQTTVLEYKLDMRRALNGDIMVFDHKEIDIIILIDYVFNDYYDEMYSHKFPAKNVTLSQYYHKYKDYLDNKSAIKILIIENYSTLT